MGNNENLILWDLDILICLIVETCIQLLIILGSVICGIATLVLAKHSIFILEHDFEDFDRNIYQIS